MVVSCLSNKHTEFLSGMDASVKRFLKQLSMSASSISSSLDVASFDVQSVDATHHVSCVLAEPQVGMAPIQTTQVCSLLPGSLSLLLALGCPFSGQR